MAADFPTNQRISRRTFLRGIAAAAGTMVLAACGGGGASGSTANGTSAPAQASGDAITITQWYHEYGEQGTQQAAKKYADEYSQVNPKVKVNMVWVAGDYSGAKLPAALLTADGPDVFEGGPTLAMVRAGQIAPLDDLVTDDIKKDFNPANLAVNTIEGKLYAIKMIDDMGLLYYRKSMLSAAGVKPPTTMDEVITAAKTLSSAKTKGLFVGNDGGISALYQLMIWSNGGDIISDNKILFDDPKTVEAFQKIKELNDSGALLIGSPTDWWDPSAFTQNLAAMQWTGLWAMPGIKKAIADDFEVVPWPALKAGSGTPVTFRGGWSQMVNAKSKHIEESKAFVKWLWLENTKDQQDWSLSYGFHIPPRMSAASSATPLKTGPASEAVDILNKYGKNTPPIWSAAMDTALSGAVSNIVKNGADAKTEVSNAAQKAQAELDKLLKG